MKHPFIVDMMGLQQDNRNIYLLMEYMQHGDLLKIISQIGRLPHRMARFYVAQLVLVFEYLQSFDLIYRDLKPENILIQQNGYIKLADFGFIKKIKPWERTFTLCGTPEYMAPEVIMNVGHGRAADWYTLGILLYELTVGRPPFMNDDTFELFKIILRDSIEFP